MTSLRKEDAMREYRGVYMSLLSTLPPPENAPIAMYELVLEHLHHQISAHYINSLLS